MEILRFAELNEIPWKNGGGITREIATGEQNGKTVWRISCADVSTDGVFSDFTGLMRILTVISDSGMVLTHDELTLDVEPWVPVRFDGALKLQSQLKGKPLTDVNVMYDPNLCNAEVITHTGPAAHVVKHPASGLVVLFVLSGAPTINASTIVVGDTAVGIAADSVLRLAKNDAVLDIRLDYIDLTDTIKFRTTKV